MHTGLNWFGILRKYPHWPSYDPDAFVELEDLTDYSTQHSREAKSAEPLLPPPWLFKNMSTYLLMDWMNSGSNQKSVGEVNRLVKEVICHEDFDARQLADFSVHHMNKVLDMSELDVPALRLLVICGLNPQFVYLYQLALKIPIGMAWTTIFPGSTIDLS
jgi:hypothetical protein